MGGLMSNSEIGGLIIILDTVLAPLAVLLCLFSLWSISGKLQMIIDMLKKMESIKIKFLDEARNQ
jgi:hypothetical protein